MKLIVYAVRDRAVDCFNQPFFSVARAAATRAFADEVNRQGSPSNSHPEDYDLYELGTYDDSSGALVPLTRPLQVAVGKELVSAKE